MSRSASRWIWLPLTALAALYMWNDLAWMVADQAPLLGEDSIRHTQRVLNHWHHLRLEPSWETFWWPNYYPPFGAWVIFLHFAAFGASVEMMQHSQVVFTGLLVLGTGTLCGRIWGSWAGVAAATLSVGFPFWWQQHDHIMLEIPATAVLVLAISLQPSPKEPDRWLRTVLGALAFGFALLSHKTTAYALLPMSAWLGGRAIVDIVRHRNKQAALHLAEVLVYGLGALLLLPWLLLSSELLEETLTRVRTEQQGTLPFRLMVGMAAWGKHAFFLPHHVWAIGLGAFAVPFGVRRSPLLIPTLLAIAGVPFLLEFAWIHERYFLIAAPLTIVVMLAPIGLLTRAERPQLRWAGRALTVPVGLFGLFFALAWHSPERLPDATMDIRYGGFDHADPNRPLEDNMPLIWAIPVRYAWALAPPFDKRWTYRPVAEALAELSEEPEHLLRPLSSPGSGDEYPKNDKQDPVVRVLDPPNEVEYLQAELISLNRTQFNVPRRSRKNKKPGQGPGTVSLSCPSVAGCYVIEMETGSDGASLQADKLEAAGYSAVATVPLFEHDPRNPDFAIIWATQP